MTIRNETAGAAPTRPGLEGSLAMTNHDPVVRTMDVAGQRTEVMSLDDFARFIGQDPAAVRREYDAQQALSPGAPFRMPPEWLRDARRRVKETAARLGTYDAADHLRHTFPGRPVHEDDQ